MCEKTKYSDAELEEFKIIILDKLKTAKEDCELLKSSIDHSDSNGTDDTSPKRKTLEDGAEILAMEEAGKNFIRQVKFIDSLNAALVRIEKKDYGICRETGKLIPKDRLRAVPHATLSIEGKERNFSRKMNKCRVF